MTRHRKCVLVADTARARLFTYGAPDHASGTTELVEVEDLVNPAARRLDSEVFTDSRPGLRQAQMGGPRHGVDDHRNDERREEARKFAVDVVAHAAAICERMDRCPLVIACSPAMLGSVRDALARGPAWLRPLAEAQFARDLTSLRPAQLHDWLADAEALPARARIVA